MGCWGLGKGLFLGGWGGGGFREEACGGWLDGCLEEGCEVTGMGDVVRSEKAYASKDAQDVFYGH